MHRLATRSARCFHDSRGPTVTRVVWARSRRPQAALSPRSSSCAVLPRGVRRPTEPTRCGLATPRASGWRQGATSTMTAMSGAVAATRPGRISRPVLMVAVFLLAAGLLGMHGLDSHAAAEHAGSHAGATDAVVIELSPVAAAVTAADPVVTAPDGAGSHDDLAALCLGLLLFAAAFALRYRARRPCRRLAAHRITGHRQALFGRPRPRPSLLLLSVARC